MCFNKEEFIKQIEQFFDIPEFREQNEQEKAKIEHMVNTYDKMAEKTKSLIQEKTDRTDEYNKMLKILDKLNKLKIKINRVRASLELDVESGKESIELEIENRPALINKLQQLLEKFNQIPKATGFFNLNIVNCNYNHNKSLNEINKRYAYLLRIIDMDIKQLEDGIQFYIKEINNLEKIRVSTNDKINMLNHLGTLFNSKIKEAFKQAKT